MKLEIDRSGYYVIKLRKFGVTQKLAIHRLVYLMFKGEIGKDDVIHHIDENKLNNIETNLMKLTKTEHRSLHNIGVKPILVSITNF
jgi:hypothetical protein